MTTFEIEGITLAVFKMEKMMAFYSNVFGIEFEEKEMLGSSVYQGTFDHFKLLFCPAELAGNDAKQNRHQLHIIVPDLTGMLEKVVEFEGANLGEIVEDDTSYSSGVYDPDRNSIVMKEWKRHV